MLTVTLTMSRLKGRRNIPNFIMDFLHINPIQFHLKTYLKYHLIFFPRNNGTCFRQCQGRAVALSSSSPSSLPLSSSLGWHGSAGGQDGLSHCLWVLSVSQDLAPCMPGQLCPPVALTLHPDSYTHCTVRAISNIKATLN